MSREALIITNPDGTSVPASEEVMSDEHHMVCQYVSAVFSDKGIAVPSMQSVTRYSHPANPREEETRTDSQGKLIAKTQLAILVETGTFPEFNATVAAIEKMRRNMFAEQPNLYQGLKGLTNYGTERALVINSIRVAADILGNLKAPTPTGAKKA